MQEVAGVAAATAGVTIRRGVTVTGLLTDSTVAGSVPRVTGVLAAGGLTLRADLVVDCGGRRSALTSWLSVSVLTLPADNGTWSVGLITSGRDRAMRGLRDPVRWDAALALYPLAAHWHDGEPAPDIDVIAGIEDRHRDFVVDGHPVATGVVAVGDAWACTNPSLGRGATLGLLHAGGLRDVLRETGTDDDDKLVRRFHQWTATGVEPLYRATLWYDRHRLAELDADAAGRPYQTDDPKWAFSLATFAASRTDPDIARAYQSLTALLATPDELFAEPGLAEKIITLGGDAPNYPLPGPRRGELLAAVGG